jgi:hypothetical protein
VTGVLTQQPGRNDNGEKNVGQIRFPNFPHIGHCEGFNSWWPMARNFERCFGCRYCVVSEYYNQTPCSEEVGFPPVELLHKIGKEVC